MSRLDAAARLHLDTVGSTSREASGHAPPTWVSATRQTAPRGRRGRAWSSPEGNLSASLVDAPPGGPAEHALRSFVASLALHDALTSLGVGDLTLKWPNDVLHRGGKLAGILLEAPHPGLLVVGIGVNLAAAPDAAALEPGATPPASLGGAVSPEALLDALIPSYAAREAQLDAAGFAATRADWLARAARLGLPIVARTMTATRHGTFDDVDEVGHLILGTPSGRVAIPAADVHFEAAPCS